MCNWCLNGRMAVHQLCVAHRYDTANLQKNIQTPKVKAALCGMRLLRKSHITALSGTNA